MFKFITHRPFWVNFLVAIVIAFILLFGLFFSLSIITGHTNTSKVPAVQGIPLEQAIKTLKQQGFNVEVTDSAYIDTVPPLAVVKQSPDNGSLVKSNRTIFLTVNRVVPPSIQMPNLVGLSYIAAKMQIKSMGLKIGDTIYRPDIAQNTILQQMQHGVDLQPGTKIVVGSKIDLVLGSGVGDEEFDVPDLVGLTYAEAKIVLESHNINIGALVTDPDVRDSARAFVYRQNPPKYIDIVEEGMERTRNQIRAGQSMDIWLSTKKAVAVKDSTNNIKE